MKKAHVNNILKEYTPSEVVSVAKAIEEGLLDNYKPKHIIAAANVLEDVTGDSKPLLLTIGQASKAWGISPALIKELVNSNKLSPILIHNSKWRFLFDDINPVITEGRI